MPDSPDHIKAVINTVALARCPDVGSTPDVSGSRQFVDHQGKPLKRLTHPRPALHRAKATVLMRGRSGWREMSEPGSPGSAHLYFPLRMSGVLLVSALLNAAVISSMCAAEPSAVVLPDGVEAVWDASNAHHETTPARERICLNCFWQ